MQNYVATTLSASTLNLASLLDLGVLVSEADSEDRLLNAVLLSVMGKLKIMRACVLQPENGMLQATHCKGMAPLAVGEFRIAGIMAIADIPQADAHLVLAELVTAVPLVVADEQIAVLCFGASLGNVPTADAHTYLELIRLVCSTAVQNARMVASLVLAKKDLESRALMVTTLFESARDFTGRLEPREILRILSYRLMGQMMLSSFALAVDPPILGQRVITHGPAAAGLRDLADDVAGITAPMRPADLLPDSYLYERLAGHRVGMVAPMHVRGERRGTLILCEKLNRAAFSDEELAFVEALGNAAMTALDAHRLVQLEVERSAMMKQLEIAAEIQNGLLPLELPAVAGVDVAAETTPSAHIGGDYYDVIPLDAQRTLFAIADVSGKGIPAALVMANVQAALNLLATLDMPLAQIVERINLLVYANTQPEVFVTMFLCILHSDTFEVEYVNAGHNPPVVVSDHEVEYLSTGGVLAGVLADAPPYQTGRTRLPAGSVLVLYTDGVTEARNAAGDEYGVDALVGSIRSLQPSAAHTILGGIQADLAGFSHSGRQDDDTSLIVIKHS